MRLFILLSFILLSGYAQDQLCTKELEITLAKSNDSFDFNILFTIDTSGTIKKRLGKNYKEQLNNIITSFIDRGLKFRLTLIPASRNSKSIYSTLYYGSKTKRKKFTTQLEKSIDYILSRSFSVERPTETALSFINQYPNLFGLEEGDQSSISLITIFIADEEDQSYKELGAEQSIELGKRYSRLYSQFTFMQSFVLSLEKDKLSYKHILENNGTFIELPEEEEGSPLMILNDYVNRVPIHSTIYEFDHEIKIESIEVLNQDGQEIDFTLIGSDLKISHATPGVARVFVKYYCEQSKLIKPNKENGLEVEVNKETSGKTSPVTKPKSKVEKYVEDYQRKKNEIEDSLINELKKHFKPEVYEEITKLAEEKKEANRELEHQIDSLSVNSVNRVNCVIFDTSGSMFKNPKFQEALNQLKQVVKTSMNGENTIWALYSDMNHNLGAKEYPSPNQGGISDFDSYWSILESNLKKDSSFNKGSSDVYQSLLKCKALGMLHKVHYDEISDTKVAEGNIFIFSDDQLRNNLSEGFYPNSFDQIVSYIILPEFTTIKKLSCLQSKEQYAAYIEQGIERYLLISYALNDDYYEMVKKIDFAQRLHKKVIDPQNEKLKKRIEQFRNKKTKLYLEKLQIEALSGVQEAISHYENLESIEAKVVRDGFFIGNIRKMTHDLSGIIFDL